MSDKRAIVTGASEGIGREFARRLADRGYAITAVARNGKRLDSLLAELGKGEHKKIVADLSRPAGVTACRRELERGHTDLLVNNAGFGGMGEFTQVPLEDQQDMIAVNVTAVMELSHAFLSQARGGDALINLSSILGLAALPTQPVYSATKAFVTSFSESLWYQYRARDIYVMGLCPGSTETNFFERAGGAAGHEPPRAIVQTPTDVVRTALAALDARRSPTVVCGAPNRLLLLGNRVLPRKSVVKLMGMGAPKARPR